MTTTLALVAAVAAALSYGIATLLQAGAAQQHSEASSLHVAMQPKYVAGLLLDGCGFLFTIAAVTRLPLYLVQSIVAANTAVTAGLAIVMGRSRPRRADQGAVAMLLLGLVLIALAARPSQGRPLSTHALWALLAFGATLTVTSVATRASGLFAAATAGASFATVNVTARGAVWSASLAATPTAFLTIGFGVLGSLLYTRALQRADVVAVTALVAAVETVVGSLAGALVLGDAARSGLPRLGAFAGVLLTVAAIAPMCRLAQPRPPVPT